MLELKDRLYMHISTKSGPGMVLGFPNDLPKKWSKSGLGIFWAFPNDLPKKWSKSAQKVVQEWPQQDLGAKNCPKSGKKIVKKWFFGK